MTTRIWEWIGLIAIIGFIFLMVIFVLWLIGIGDL
jgi:hypothetical protein